MTSHSGGVLPASLFQGLRSETLARFALSAFGPATNVEGKDDHGIDLICATARRVGQRLHVGPAYNVQVKSDNVEVVEFPGPHARTWLEGLGSPLLVARVDKGRTRVRLYSTWGLSRVLLNLATYGGQDEVFRLVMEAGVTVDQPPADTIPLGPPIIDFVLTELADLAYVERLTTCIEQWVQMDTENIVRRKLGLAVAKGYTKWVPNTPPSEQAPWYKPFFFSEATAEQARKVIAECAGLLVIRNDEAETGALKTYLGKFCDLRTLDPVLRAWLKL